MARRLEYVPLDDLVRAEVNPKDHDAPGIAASITRLGFIEPILHDGRTGRLIAGHGRLDDLLARQAAGAELPEGIEVGDDGRWRAPVVFGWSSRDDDDAIAAGIALNHLTERGGWRGDELVDQLNALIETPAGLTGTGYERDDLDDLLAGFQEQAFAYDPEKPDVHTVSGERPVIHEHSIADRLQNYRTKSIRSLVLDYPLPEYEAVAGAAQKARADKDVASNAELFAALLEPWR